MSVHDYINVDPDDFPYKQEVELDGITKRWIFQWNDLARIMTVDLEELDGTEIYSGEPLILYQELWRGLNLPGLPYETIMPLDESHQEVSINPGNLGSTVKLAILDLDTDV